MRAYSSEGDMSEEIPDPDEPLAFGQVWRYRLDGSICMVVEPGEFTRGCHLQSPYERRDTGSVDPAGSGWASLRDKLPEYWERLA
jgi:hypothetical protein